MKKTYIKIEISDLVELLNDQQLLYKLMSDDQGRIELFDVFELEEITESDILNDNRFLLDLSI